MKMAEEKKSEITQAAQPPAPRQWTIGVRQNEMAFSPRTWQEMLDFANLVSKTEFVPADFRDKPGSVLAAWQTGHEIGLPPMASLKYIAVINGRTRIWGNAYWALVKSHPLCEYTRELPEHEALANGYGECTVKRKGDKDPVVARFTKEMAEQAGVWGGKGADDEKRRKSVWFLRPGRMLQWMARNLAGNDAIPEATLGVEIAELAEDEPRDVTPPQPEPLKIPQPIKEKTDGSNSDPGTTTEGTQADAKQPPTNDGQDQSGTEVTGEKAEPERSEMENNPRQKTVEEIALEEIAGYTADTFPLAKELNKYLQKQPGKVQARICRAYNDRKKELGL